MFKRNGDKNKNLSLYAYTNEIQLCFEKFLHYFFCTFASLKDTDKEKDINLKSVNVQKEENEHNLRSLVS